MITPMESNKSYITETGALISYHDYIHLSDNQKSKCKPYTTPLTNMEHLLNGWNDNKSPSKGVGGEPIPEGQQSFEKPANMEHKIDYEKIVRNAFVSPKNVHGGIIEAGVLAAKECVSQAIEQERQSKWIDANEEPKKVNEHDVYTNCICGIEGDCVIEDCVYYHEEKRFFNNQDTTFSYPIPATHYMYPLNPPLKTD